MSTHSEVNRERHAFKRRVLDHAFTTSAISSAETFILDNIRTWCKHLAEGAKPGEWTPEKNMADWCTYIGYDIMGDLVFGKRFDVMETNEHRFVPELMMGALQFLYPVWLPSTLPFPKQKIFALGHHTATYKALRSDTSLSNPSSAS
jgi:cytochrome P450